MEGKNRLLNSVMSISTPSSVSTGSSMSARCATVLGPCGGEATTLDELGTPMSSHNSLEGDEIATGGEKPKGGRTGGESSSTPLFSLPLPFKSLACLSSGLREAIRGGE